MTENDSGVKIEVHLIQNFAPSNLNRDDTGQPKSAWFGGYRRARISSQCIKRSARMWWKEHDKSLIGTRTKRLQELLLNALKAKDSPLQEKPDEESLKQGIRIFTDAYYAAADKKKPTKTNVSVFIGPEEVNACAKEIAELWSEIAPIVKKLQKEKPRGTAMDEAGDEETAPAGEEGKKKGGGLKLDKEIVERIRQARISADIALFGRMLAEQPGRNTEAACQVAHAISTHKVNMEMDYFTAVDDLSPEDETGADMLGEVGYNSACLYRYAVVDRDQLARNLSRKIKRENGEWKEKLEPEDYKEADKVIEAFLKAMVYAIPTGKQNSFAAQNLPSFGLFVRRKDGVPVSLANAFTKPVHAGGAHDDIIGLSVERLARHLKELKEQYGNLGEKKTACFTVGVEKGLLGSLKDSCKSKVEDAVKAVLE